MPTRPLGYRLFSGTVWMFAMRWVTRALSVISIATLARLLNKEDFGLVALASSVVALPAVLMDLGVEQAIISERTPERGLYNTAWTLRAIQLTIAAALIYSLSSTVASFYGDVRIAPMLEVLSLMVVLHGLQNMWTVSFRKELNFRRDFVYDTTSKAAAVAITISLALWLRSYWALVYGQLAGAGIRVMMSLSLAPEWPRLTLSHWKSIWSFSQWSLSKGIATYIVANGDRIILGRLSDPATVGAYSLAREIADMPLTEISMPVNRALGPGFSALQDDTIRLSRALTKSLTAVATIAFPIGFGLAVTAEQVIPIFLGNRWMDAIAPLQLLAIASTITAVRGVMGNTLAVIGYIRSAAAIMWVRAALLVATTIPGALIAGAAGIAGAFVIAEALTSGATIFFYRKHLPHFSLTGLGRALLRPAMASVVMAVIVSTLDGAQLSALPLLLAKVMVGTLTYGFLMFVFWHRAGYPEGLERMVMERIYTPWRAR